jgi:hypothetical protein
LREMKTEREREGDGEVAFEKPAGSTAGER